MSRRKTISKFVRASAAVAMMAPPVLAEPAAADEASKGTATPPGTEARASQGTLADVEALAGKAIRSFNKSLLKSSTILQVGGVNPDQPPPLQLGQQPQPGKVPQSK